MSVYHALTTKLLAFELVSSEPKFHKVSLLDGTFKLEYLLDQQAVRFQIYLEHYLGRGKFVLGFRPYMIRTLVSMATDSSHRVKMCKIV